MRRKLPDIQRSNYRGFPWPAVPGKFASKRRQHLKEWQDKERGTGLISDFKRTPAWVASFADHLRPHLQYCIMRRQVRGFNVCEIRAQFILDELVPLTFAESEMVKGHGRPPVKPAEVSSTCVISSEDQAAPAQRGALIQRDLTAHKNGTLKLTARYQTCTC